VGFRVQFIGIHFEFFSSMDILRTISLNSHWNALERKAVHSKGSCVVL